MVIVSKASAVSSSDMWTPINTDTYLAVTCHFIHASSSLHSVFPAANAAENLAKVEAALVLEWGITHTFNAL